MRPRTLIDCEAQRDHGTTNIQPKLRGVSDVVMGEGFLMLEPDCEFVAYYAP